VRVQVNQASAGATRFQWRHILQIFSHFVKWLLIFSPDLYISWSLISSHVNKLCSKENLTANWKRWHCCLILWSLASTDTITGPDDVLLYYCFFDSRFDNYDPDGGFCHRVLGISILIARKFWVSWTVFNLGKGEVPRLLGRHLGVRRPWFSIKLVSPFTSSWLPQAA
jgi:hypothetical protein